MPVTNAPTLAYGKVVYRELLVQGDDLTDDDALPNTVASTGSLGFLPVGTVSRVNGPDEWVVLSRTRIAGLLDNEGYLVDQNGVRGQWLVTGYYDVSFGTRSGIAPFRIKVTEDHTNLAPLDLASSVPMSPDPTTIFVVNEQVYLDTLAARDAALNVIPAGGTSGQSLVKASDADRDLHWSSIAGGSVASVNTKTGEVVLDAADVHALPDTTALLELGTTSATAKAGDWEPGVADISGATDLGKSLLSASDKAAALAAIGAATSAQGALADSAVQPGDLAAVATSGSYTDLSGKPAIPSSKADVGLGNVDNTSDVDKPVSTAQATAIGAKYSKPGTGIPGTDLDAGTQTSLGKADSALQSVPAAPTADTLSGATAVGKAVMKATNAAAARTATGAGTSDLAVGTAGTDAMRGNAIIVLAAATTLPAGLPDGTLIARY